MKLEKLDNEQIKQIKEKLNNDELIVFPTDTVFGVASNIFSDNAIEKIYELKNRQKNKPISILVANKEQIKKITNALTIEEEQVIDKLMPRALTLVVKKADNLAKNISSNDFVGIRIPNNEYLIKLLENVRPLATTSANISGQKELSSIVDIKNTFGKKVGIYIDGTVKKDAKASTVAQIIDGNVKILRQGDVLKKEIEAAIGK